MDAVLHVYLVPGTSYLGLCIKGQCVEVKRNGLLLETEPMAISNRMLEKSVSGLSAGICRLVLGPLR